MRGYGKTLPKYRKHKRSGQAVVTLSGVDHYLGPHGTKVSKQEYDKLVAEWLNNGRQTQSADEPVTVVEVIAAYLKFAKRHYRKNGRPTSSFAGLKSALKELRHLYGRLPAIEFGPKRLKALRLRMQEPQDDPESKRKRLSRQTINKHCATIRRMFRWAAAEELVPASVPQAPSMVNGLERNRTTAPESPPVLPVADSVVNATLDHLPAVVADMVRLQRLTGMRPAEVCQMRPADIDTKSDVWTYRPESHKTQHHGHSRVIPIGPQGQDVLRKYLVRGADDYCFDPRDSEKKRRRELTANRRIPISYGNCPGTNRKRTPKRQPGNRYSPDSYRRAIQRACDVAFKPAEKLSDKSLRQWQADHRWSPNQLRHSAATAIRSEFGLEAAQVTLGHSNANITQVYAERDLQKAIDVARQVLDSARIFPVRKTLSDVRQARSPHIRQAQESFTERRVLGFDAFQGADGKRVQAFSVQSYGPVIEPLQVILRAVNRARRKRGFTPVHQECIPRKLYLTKVYVEPERRTSKSSELSL